MQRFPKSLKGFAHEVALAPKVEQLHQKSERAGIAPGPVREGAENGQGLRNNQAPPRLFGVTSAQSCAAVSVSVTRRARNFSPSSLMCRPLPIAGNMSAVKPESKSIVIRGSNVARMSAFNSPMV